jgi:hypothetical protein
MKYEEFYKKSIKELGFKLVMNGTGNFDYYLDNKLNCIHYIAKKGTGCDDGVFGNIKYFQRLFNQELKKNPNLDGRLTATGFKVLSL